MNTGQALLAALTHAAPELAACRDDERFTQDLPVGQVARARRIKASMAVVCRECPLFDLCEQTAEATDASAGFWAGRSYDNLHKRTDWHRRG